MKKILIILIILVANLDIYSQSIKLVRTDVDSTRKNFVTATYMFGFDVQIDGLQNCNNASFQLKFDNAQYIKYSGAMLNDFKDSGTVFIYEYKEPGTNEIYLNIGVFSGQPLGENDFDNPNLLRLEFVVTPTAPNDERVTFTFINAFGSTYQDGTGQSVQLASTPTILEVHGYVDVWPGDTDNNQVVDNVDWTTVSENLKFKERFPGYRSFKRENATTNWFPQRSLVWDVEDATYADCDGDGEISVTDGLVVLLNLSTAQNSIIKEPKAQILQNNDNLIPVYIEHHRNYRGIFGQIEFDNIEIEDVVIGDLFSMGNSMFHVEQNTMNFTLGNMVNSQFVDKSGIAFYIKTKEPVENLDLNFIQLRGISETNTLFNLHQSALSVEKDNKYNVIYTGDELRIESNERVNSFKIIDIRGNLLSENFNTNQTKIDLISGYYMVIIESNERQIKYPLMILK